MNQKPTWTQLNSSKRTLLKITSLLFVIVLLASCAASIKTDPLEHADDANFQTAEFYACGHHYKGLGICVVDPGVDLNSVALSIQGYYNGRLHIFSSTCGVSDNVDYTDSQLIAYGLPGKVTQSCEITFVVTPIYPGQTSQVIVISPLSGTLKVNMRSRVGEKIHTYVSRVKSGFSQKISIPVAGAGPYRVLLQGCSGKIDQMMSPVKGVITVESKAFIPVLPLQTCSVFGGIGTLPSTTWVSWLVDVYDLNYVDLAIPAVVIGSTVSINADNSAGIVALNSNFQVGSSAQFSNVDLSKPFTIRVLTAGARDQIGDWSPGRGVMRWLP